MPCSNAPEIVQWAPLASAIATSAAVFVALFRESIFLWWRRPLLSLSIKTEMPDCNKGELRFGNGTAVNCYFLRIWIENRGKSTANRVQVFAKELLKKHADGNYNNEPRFMPMNLTWTHTNVVFNDGIAADMGQHCELGRIFPPGFFEPNLQQLPSHIPNNKTSLVIETEIKTFAGNSHLEPGNYHLQLRVAAANSKPKDFFLEINHTGEWFEDARKMFTQGIGIKLIDRI